MYCGAVHHGQLSLNHAEEIVQGNLLIATLNALHIASLMAFEAAASIQIPFVTADKRQAEAAKHQGLNVIRVG